MLTVTTARASSDDSAICYVLPVLWMTLCLPAGRGDASGALGICSKRLTMGSTKDEV